MQHFSYISRLILQVLTVLIIIRILMHAAGLPIIEYIPIIDDVIRLIFNFMTALASGLHNIVKRVVYF